MEAENSQDKGKSASYLGITVTSAHDILVSHREYPATKNRKGPMARHDRDGHNGKKMSYTTTVPKKENKIVSLVRVHTTRIACPLYDLTL